MAGETLYTIGHSTHRLDRFLALLGSNGIEVLADVRSVPFSRHAPAFNQRGLERALSAAGITYIYLGDELGGRPPEPDLYDENSHVRYGALARTQRFRDGVQRLRAVLDGATTAVLCAEEDPDQCHRRLLVGRVLADEGIVVRDIRSDGRVEETPFRREGHQLGMGGDADWKSPKPVPPPRRRSTRRDG